MKSKLLLFTLLNMAVVGSSYAQTDCGNNAGFELGNTNGWICKSGTYGAGVLSGYCPAVVLGTCPEFPTNLTTTGIINTNGINAPLNTGVDRHTIMTSAYLAAGGPAGYDSISNWTVPVVAPGGGSYSFRLGDAVTGAVGSNPNRLARSEAIRLSFLVTPSNTLFTYRYAVFLQNGAHLPEEQPRFDVKVTDAKDSIIPGGYYHFVAGSANPFCQGTIDSSIFKFGGTGDNANWRYTDWRDACVDLSGYIGQNVSVEFRTTDCFPANSVVYTSGGVQTSCSNGICHWSLPTAGATTISTCTNTAGTHSAYAYIDAYCSTLPHTTFKDSTMCEGDSIVLTTTSGVTKYYIWSPSTGLNDHYNANPVANPTVTTTYTLYVENAGGCSFVDSVKINVIPLSTCITGLDKNGKNVLITISPNPSSNKFTVSFSKPISNVSLKIFNMMGEEVYEQTVNGKQETVNTSLSSGIYFVQVRDEERQYIQKIVVQ